MGEIKGAVIPATDDGAVDQADAGVRGPLLSNPLLSLEALKDASSHSPPIRYSGPDSGKIVLSSLPRNSPSTAPAVLDALPALAAPEPELVAEPARPRRHTKGLGIGIALAGMVLAAVIAYATRAPRSAQATTPAAAPSARAAEPLPAATVAVTASAEPAPGHETSATTRPVVSKANAPKKARAESSGDNPYAEGTAQSAPTVVETPKPAAAPPKPANPCGCQPQDLKCNMDCAVSGKK